MKKLKLTMLSTAFAFVAFVPASAAAMTTDSFAYTGSIVSWIAPHTGSYTVTAIGAQGASGDVNYRGGRGAQITGTFDLIVGTVFQILVGGVGGGQGSGNGAGGGGTFFVTAADNPLLVAGGGGGTRSAVLQNGTDASVTQAAYRASGSSASYTPTLKHASTIGQGGIVSSGSWGSGGGGFFSNGQNDGNNSSGNGGGKSWLNGMLGGSAGSCGSPGLVSVGGFGGGGSGNGCYGGGGGGGYSGGDGGRVAGGGGSYNAGYAQMALAGVGYGHGSLTITYDKMSVVPLPAALPLLAGGLGILGLAGWRRRERKG